MAAVLVGGTGAVLSHRSAGALWGMRPSARVRAEVTARRHVRSRPKIEIHRAALRSDEITALRGIPVTTVPRTLVDLAAVLAPRQVELAVHEAEVRRLLDTVALLRLIARYPRRHGVPGLRQILASQRIGSIITRSQLEERFLEFVNQRDLPCPELNAAIQVGERWVECDCVWRAQSLIAELDGRAFHDTALAYERDRDRDRRLHAAGWRVVRITWYQLHRDADELARDLRTLIFRRHAGDSASGRSGVGR